MKVKVSITIDKTVYEQAHSLGINVSKASENYLRFLIEAVQKQQRRFEAGPKGFEPLTFSLEGSSQWAGSGEDWNRFNDWLTSKKYNPRHKVTLYNYAMKYSDCLFKRDLSRLLELSGSFRHNVLNALSSLAKFTGRYEDWIGLIKQYDLKWSSGNKDQVFIDRLENVKDPGEIWNWIKTSKESCPRVVGLMDLMAVTGLRFVEGVDSINLALKLEKNGRLGQYYFRDKGTLEHYHFKETFLRRSKKAFVSFVTDDIVKEMLESDSLNTNTIQMYFRNNQIQARFGDIREAHATFMTKFLKPSEIDFLHGRVTASIFMANYFNPSLIVDLKERAFQGIKEIRQKIGGD